MLLHTAAVPCGSRKLSPDSHTPRPLKHTDSTVCHKVGWKPIGLHNRIKDTRRTLSYKSCRVRVNAFSFDSVEPVSRNTEAFPADGVTDEITAADCSRRSLLTLAATGLLLDIVGAEQALAAAPGSSDAVTSALEKAFKETLPPTKAAAVLRLVFHDSGTYDVGTNTGGANASVRFELDRPENTRLSRGYTPVRKAKELLVGTPAEGLSTADLIAWAGAYAVRITGGPTIDVPFGRVDADAADPEGRLPAETATPLELKQNFEARGLTTQEFVVLSGAHTIGGKGFGEPLAFDNTYFQTLIKKPWENPTGDKYEREMAQMIGLPSDKALPLDDECLKWIEVYAADGDAFFRDFSTAYLKLTKLGTQLA